MMKKMLFMIALLLTLTVGVDGAAQKHRHTPQPDELVDSTATGGIEAFSDTTSAAQPVAPADEWDDDADDQLERSITSLVTSWSSKDTLGVVLVLGVLFIIFVLAPVLIIAALFYFINKNRKQKIQLAQMAVQQGQPIPDHLLEDRTLDADDEYQRGLRQLFVGIGLMAFLGYAAGEVGFGVGALVACIGLGKIAASKLGRKN